jgi:hypothetical protein
MLTSISESIFLVLGGRRSGLRSTNVGYATFQTVYYGLLKSAPIDSSDLPDVSGIARKT